MQPCDEVATLSSTTLAIVFPQDQYPNSIASGTALFSHFGDVARIDLSLRLISGKAFVTFFDVRAAEKALMAFEGRAELAPSEVSDFRTVAVNIGDVHGTPSFRNYGEIVRADIRGQDFLVEFYDMRAAQLACCSVPGLRPETQPLPQEMPSPVPQVQEHQWPHQQHASYVEQPQDLPVPSFLAKQHEKPWAQHLAQQRAQPQQTDMWAPQAQAEQKGPERAMEEQLRELRSQLMSQQRIQQRLLEQHMCSTNVKDGATTDMLDGLMWQLQCAEQELQAVAAKAGKFGGVSPASSDSGRLLSTVPTTVMFPPGLGPEDLNEHALEPATIGMTEKPNPLPAAVAHPAPHANAKKQAAATGNGTGRGGPREKLSSQDLSKFDIVPENVMSGEDTRTTVMVRNIPKQCSRDEFVQILAACGVGGRYSFFYMPSEKNKQRNAHCGFAFVHFKAPHDVLRLATCIRAGLMQRFPSNGSSAPPILSYARLQGEQQLAKHFHLAAVMSASDVSKRPVFLNKEDRPVFLKHEEADEIETSNYNNYMPLRNPVKVSMQVGVSMQGQCAGLRHDWRVHDSALGA